MKVTIAILIGFLLPLGIGVRDAGSLPSVVREANAQIRTPSQYNIGPDGSVTESRMTMGSIAEQEAAKKTAIAAAARTQGIMAGSTQPEAVIESSVKQTVPGRLVMLSAKSSTGVKRLRWYVEPSTGIDIELVEDGWRCVLVPNQPIKYRVTLVVSSPDGEIADAVLDLPPLIDAEDSGAASGIATTSPAVIHALGTKPNYGPAIRGLAAKLKGPPAEAAALAGSLRSAAGMIAIGEIRNYEEMDRAVTRFVAEGMGPAVVRWAPIIQELDRALESERGSDLQRLHEVLFQLAAAIDGAK